MDADPMHTCNLKTRNIPTEVHCRTTLDLIIFFLIYRRLLYSLKFRRLLPFPIHRIANTRKKPPPLSPIGNVYDILLKIPDKIPSLTSAELNIPHYESFKYALNKRHKI